MANSALKGHLGTRAFKALGHLGTQDTRPLEGHLGTRALNAVRHLDTRSLEGHLGTQAFEALYLADLNLIRMRDLKSYFKNRI